MKRQLFTLMLLLLGTLVCHAEYSVINGDLNHDGKLSVVDLTMLNNIILNKNRAQTIESRSNMTIEEMSMGTVMLNGDMNHDDKITDQDVRLMARTILEELPNQVVKSRGVFRYGEVSELKDYAVLADGEDFYKAINRLLDPTGGPSEAVTNIQPFKMIFHKTGLPKGKILVSRSDSPVKVRAEYDDSKNKVDIYVPAERLVFPASCKYMFFLSMLEEIDWSEFGSDIDTRNVTDMSYMFSGCVYLTTLDLSHFDTSKVTDMSGMFNWCSDLTTLDVSNFDTSNVTSMYGMFNCCSLLTTLKLSNFVTTKVTDMSWMFNWCLALTTLDISSFDTSLVEDMNTMFANCSKLSTLKLGRKFTIARRCNTEDMLLDTPTDSDTPTCIVYCTSATQTRLSSAETGIVISKFRWNNY